MNTQLMFSSATAEWATPQAFFDRMNAEFHFETDVCATSENAKCSRFYTEECDGLAQVWEGACWMNPPYGEPEHPCKLACKKKRCVKRGCHCLVYVPGICDWIKKAYESARTTGATVVCLLPARTDTAWWHDYCMKAEFRLVRGRLNFGDGKAPAPFPSAVVIFRPPHQSCLPYPRSIPNKLKA
jgi:phage N-6-adenine-methyltransferase